MFAIAMAAAPAAFAMPPDSDHTMKDPTETPPDTKPDSYKNDAKDNDRMTIDQLPVAVKTTVQKETNGKSIDTIRKDTTNNGQTVYKIDMTDNKGAQTTLTVSATGKVVDRGTPTTKTPAGQQP